MQLEIDQRMVGHVMYTDVSNLCRWKTLLCLPSVPAKWIASECRSGPHRKEQAMISNTLLPKGPQWRQGLPLTAVHKQMDGESPQRRRLFSRKMEQLWLVLFEPFPHYCGLDWKKGSEDSGQPRMANLLYVLYLILVGSGHLVKVIVWSRLCFKICLFIYFYLVAAK